MNRHELYVVGVFPFDLNGKSHLSTFMDYAKPELILFEDNWLQGYTFQILTGGCQKALETVVAALGNIEPRVAAAEKETSTPEEIKKLRIDVEKFGKMYRNFKNYIDSFQEMGYFSFGGKISKQPNYRACRVPPVTESVNSQLLYNTIVMELLSGAYLPPLDIQNIMNMPNFDEFRSKMVQQSISTYSNSNEDLRKSYDLQLKLNLEMSEDSLKQSLETLGINPPKIEPSNIESVRKIGSLFYGYESADALTDFIRQHRKQTDGTIVSICSLMNAVRLETKIPELKARVLKLPDAYCLAKPQHTLTYLR
jgi:hypothetical protein